MGDESQAKKVNNDLSSESPSSQQSQCGSIFSPDSKVVYSISHSGDDIKIVSKELLDNERQKNGKYVEGMPQVVEFANKAYPDISGMSALSIHQKEQETLDTEMDTET